MCDALCSIPLAATLHRLAEQALEGGGGEGGGGTYAALLSAAHRGAVSALACAVSKPILVSASADERSVRVWDVSTGECSLAAALPEEPLGVALHPDGMQLVIAYRDRLSFSHVAPRELLRWRELPLPSGGLARYCRGGQWLAASSAASVVVLDSYTHDRLATLPCAAAVTALSWGVGGATSDLTLVSGGADGMVYAWRVDSRRRVHELMPKAAGGVVALAMLPDATAAADAAARAAADGSFSLRRGGGDGVRDGDEFGEGGGRGARSWRGPTVRCAPSAATTRRMACRSP